MEQNGIADKSERETTAVSSFPGIDVTSRPAASVWSGLSCNECSPAGMSGASYKRCYTNYTAQPNFSGKQVFPGFVRRCGATLPQQTGSDINPHLTACALCVFIKLSLTEQDLVSRPNLQTIIATNRCPGQQPNIKHRCLVNGNEMIPRNS